MLDTHTEREINISEDNNTGLNKGTYRYRLDCIIMYIIIS